MPIPENIRLYRMVHYENVGHILQYGLCCSSHANANPNFVNIGMQSLISDRHDYAIPIEDKGNLGEYIPFYFAGHSPMLYMIMNGYGGVTQRAQNDIVFVVVAYDTIVSESLDYVFTDRNAKIALANYFDNEQGLESLNWDIIQSKEWANTNQQLDKRDLKQAEFLVREHIPTNCIHALVVKTEVRKQALEEQIANFGLTIPVFVDNNLKLYY